MTLSININAGATVNGGLALGLMTSAGNPWTVPDALAQELVNRGVATASGWPVPVRITGADFTALIAAGRLQQGQLYDVDGAARIALTPTTYDSFSSGGSFGAAPSLMLDIGTGADAGTYTGPPHYTPDHLGVYRYRPANVPPLVGARLDIQWLDYASAPASWYAITSGTGTVGAPTAGQSNWQAVADTDASGNAITALAIYTHTATAGPYISQIPLVTDLSAARSPFGPGTISVISYDVKQVVGSVNGAIYHRPIDNGVQPTESRGGSFTHAAAGTWKRVTHAMQLNSMQYGLKFRPDLIAPEALVGEFRVANVMLQRASGIDANAFTPAPFIANSGAGPAYRYSDTVNGNSRDGSSKPANTNDILQALTGGPGTVVGAVTSAAGATISGSDPFKGFLQEPAVTNLCNGDNWLSGIGWGKVSSATTGYTGTTPLQASPSSPTQALRFEAASMARFPAGSGGGGYVNRIATVQGANDTITNLDNDFLAQGWKTGDGIFGVVLSDTTTLDVVLPVTTVTNVAAGTLTLASANTIPVRAAAGGLRVKLFRVPKVSDQVLVVSMLTGAQHRTSVTGVVTPSFAGGWDAKAPVLIDLAANPPSDGGWVNTDNAIHCFYWTNHTDFGFGTLTNLTFDIAYDREGLRAAGLDDLSGQAGLYMVFTRTAANPDVTLGSATGSASRDTVMSCFAKELVHGSGGYAYIQQNANAASNANITSASWARVRSTPAASVGATNMRLTLLGANASVGIVGWQFEQSSLAAVGSCPFTSPIVNPRNNVPSAGAGGTRTAKRLTWPWNTTVNGTITSKKNNFFFNFDYTPSQALVGAIQCLAWVGTVADGCGVLLEESSGTWTFRFRKNISSASSDTTITSITVAAGTTYGVAVAASSTAGMTMTVNGVVAAPNVVGNALLDVALTAASAFDLGSALGTGTGATAANAAAAFGALRKTPSAAKLFG